MKIGVFGTGYVGLVASVCFADSGNSVVGVDIDAEKIAKLRDGIVPIYEPGLEDLLKSALKHKRIEFTTDKSLAIRESQVLFIAVGTPEGEDGSADVSRVLEVAEFIGREMKEEKLIVLKSTVPVGTAEKVTGLVRTLTNLPFDVVSNPEFLKEGASIDDFLRPDRVVIGCSEEKTRKTMANLYAPFVKNGNPILFMSNKSAELTKYAANAFLATKISFINELAQLADAMGADVEEVKRGFTSDSRINPAFFYPGVGYGGSCFPKDVKALVKMGRQKDLAMEVVSATDRANDAQRKLFVKKVKNHFKQLSGLKIAMWGLSFKPRTDDVREAPSFTIIEELLKEGSLVRAYDPVAIPNSQKHFKEGVEWVQTGYDALRGSDALIIVTEWNEFRSPDFTQMKALMKQPVIFDGRNIYDPSTVRKLGFKYYGIGRDNA